jgi:hypothetical protein
VKSLKVCALLDKPDCHKLSVHVDYLGFSVPNKFVVGYGLDHGEQYRNLPYIGVLKPSLCHQEPNAGRIVRESKDRLRGPDFFRRLNERQRT